MRFTLQMPTDKVRQIDEFLTPEALSEMGKAAESAGFSACYVTEHPIPDDAWLAAGGHHAIDPFVALSFLAAATTTIGLQTHLLVLPYRNPFLTAKSIASLDLLSKGRVIAGVGAGYLESEFTALGADYEHRNERTDEAIRIMRETWKGESTKLQGEGFHSDGNTALPRPFQQPAPPIWVGGNSKRAIRRAVELGDGWLPFPAPPKMAERVGTAPLVGKEGLAERLDYAGEHAAKVGRTEPLEVCYSPVGMGQPFPEPDALVELSGELEAMGVGCLVIILPHKTRAQFVDEIAAFGDAVISRA